MAPQLLILDLDETLVYGAEAPLPAPWDFTVGPYFIYRRPHLPEFLAASFGGFDVAVFFSPQGRNGRVR